MLVRLGLPPFYPDLLDVRKQLHQFSRTITDYRCLVSTTNEAEMTINATIDSLILALVVNIMKISKHFQG